MTSRALLAALLFAGGAFAAEPAGPPDAGTEPRRPARVAPAQPKWEGPAEPLAGPCEGDGECGLVFHTAARCGKGVLKKEAERWQRELAEWCKANPKTAFCATYPGCPTRATTAVCRATRCEAADAPGRKR